MFDSSSISRRFWLGMLLTPHAMNFLSPESQAQVQPPLLAEIARVWNARRDAISTLRAEWEINEFYAAGIFSKLRPSSDANPPVYPAQDTRIPGRRKLIISGSKIRMENETQIWDMPSKEFIGFSVTAAQDGMNETHLNRDHKASELRGFITKQKYASPSINAWPFVPLIRGTDRLLMKGHDLSEFITYEEKVIDKKKWLYLISPRNELTGEDRIGLLPGPGFEPMLRECYDRDGHLVTIWRVTSTYIHPTGLIIPDQWTFTSYCQQSLARHLDCKLLNCEVNGPVTESFRVDFPVGTRVSDQTDAKNPLRTYLITPTNPSREIATDDLHLSDSEILSADAGDHGLANKAFSLKRYAATALLGMVVLLSILVAARYFLDSRRQKNLSR